MAMKRLKISRGGQVSVPAAVRGRWRTNTVVAEDRGDHLVLRPAPDDPIAAARGALKDELEVDTDTMRREAREDELRSAERRWGWLSERSTRRRGS